MADKSDFKVLAQQAKDAETRGELPYAEQLYAQLGKSDLNFSQLIAADNFPCIASAADFYKRTGKNPEGTPDFVKAVGAIQGFRELGEVARAGVERAGLAISTTKKKIDTINSRMGSIGAGLITGGGLGTAIAGPVGAIIGAFAGAVIGGIAERFREKPASADNQQGEE